jgi:prolyl-tRNA synthetase
MQDGKALQMGTSHLLSQSFAYAFEMKFQDQQGNMIYPYLTSWGTTTRLIGAVVMVHGDQKGLVLPPQVAPIQVVIVPIVTKNSDISALMDAVQLVADELQKADIRVHIDDREETPGAKFYHWELRGVPLRIEIGSRDLAQESCIISDRLGNAKEMIKLSTVVTYVQSYLPEFHKQLYNRATAHLKSMWYIAHTLAEIIDNIETKPGFYQTGWCQDAACEAVLKEHKITTRCLIDEHKLKVCFNCGKPSIQDVLVARAY